METEEGLLIERTHFAWTFFSLNQERYIIKGYIVKNFEGRTKRYFKLVKVIVD